MAEINYLFKDVITITIIHIFRNSKTLLLGLVCVYSACTLKIHMYANSKHCMFCVACLFKCSYHIFVDNRSIESSKLLEVAQMHNEALRVWFDEQCKWGKLPETV